MFSKELCELRAEQSSSTRSSCRFFQLREQGNSQFFQKQKAVRWVHESDEVALTTEPCLSVGANRMIGPRAAPSSPHSPFPLRGIHLERFLIDLYLMRENS
ncbi:hypothetical protein Csa_023289 [Cucumis sativus]|nr:hypothetical protein Csa_023289 [Cucumis sativus]